MIPLFGNERKRQINLGGHSSSASHDSILNEAKAKREARQDQKRRLHNAVRIQAWWRGMREARAVRQELRKTFEQDVTGMMGLRCLVLVGQDERALAMWSTAMVSSGEGEMAC
jgi:ubiquitin-protein ligase E3 C